MWMGENNFTPKTLEEALGYNSDGLLVRTYLGELESSRQPSQPFLDRLEKLGFSGSDYHTERHIAKGVSARTELPPGTHILSDPRQCPECAAEAQEGKRSWAQTWYVFPWGNQIYCCEEHRRAWYKRQASKELSESLE